MNEEQLGIAAIVFIAIAAIIVCASFLGDNDDNDFDE